jgi:hypothetical protein
MPQRVSSHEVSRAPVQLADHAEGGADGHRGETAGVAVGEQPWPGPAQLGDQVGAEPRHRRRRGDLLVPHGARLGENGLRPVRDQGGGTLRAAGQVHRRRACGFDLSYGHRERHRIVDVDPGGKRHTEGARHAQGGRAAYRERLDRRDQLAHGVQAQHPLLAGQGRLIDDLDGPVDPIDGPQTIPPAH